MMVLFGGLGILIGLIILVSIGIPLIGLLLITLLSLVLKTFIGISLFQFVYGFAVIAFFFLLSGVFGVFFLESNEQKVLFFPTMFFGTLVGVIFAVRSIGRPEVTELVYGSALAQGVTPIFEISNNIIFGIGIGAIVLMFAFVALISAAASRNKSAVTRTKFSSKESSSGRGPAGLFLISSFMVFFLLIGVVFAAPTLFRTRGCADGTNICDTKVSVFDVEIPYDVCNPILSVFGPDIDVTIGDPNPSRQSVGVKAQSIDDVSLFIRVFDSQYDTGEIEIPIGDLGDNPAPKFLGGNSCKDGKASLPAFGAINGLPRTYQFSAVARNPAGDESEKIMGSFIVRG